MPRNRPANGARIRAIRERLEWAQEKLALHGGLSSRVIAKAESSARVSSTTLARIAEAFRKAGEQVLAEDLMTSPISVANELLEHYRVASAELASRSRHLLSEDLVTEINGDPAWLRIAGEHHGVEAFDKLCEAVFSAVERKGGSLGRPPSILACDNHVVAWGNEVIGVPETSLDACVFVLLRVTVIGGLVTNCGIYFDSLGIGARLEKWVHAVGTKPWARLARGEAVRRGRHWEF